MVPSIKPTIVAHTKSRSLRRVVQIFTCHVLALADVLKY